MFFRKHFDRDEYASGANRAEYYVREVWSNIKQTQPRKIVPIFKTCPSWEYEAVSGPGLTLLPLPCFIPCKLCKTAQDSISFLFVQHGFRFGRKYSSVSSKQSWMFPTASSKLLTHEFSLYKWASCWKSRPGMVKLATILILENIRWG